ncbi:MAG TPA: RteC domain-containing protein [Mucilaginibacter sp.]|nr:RteC domain-containing protein [Mucilaginibacter sp.]
MFNEFYEALYDALCRVLQLVLGTEKEPVKRLSRALQEIRSACAELRDKALSAPFPSAALEINFFKTIKPKFYALRIFHIELYHLDANKPAGTRELLLRFYRQELSFIERFFHLHHFLYRYYKAGLTEMDELYFLRGAQLPAVLEPELPDADPEFSTAQDHLFARFIALEALQQEIILRMSGLDGTLVPAGPDQPVPVPALKWTGSKVNLVELVYGLYYTGQLNHGQAEVVEIAAHLEQVFGFALKDAHDTFGDIRDRKKLSPAHFLESMAAAIQARKDEDLAYKPELKKALENQWKK